MVDAFWRAGLANGANGANCLNAIGLTEKKKYGAIGRTIANKSEQLPLLLLPHWAAVICKRSPYRVSFLSADIISRMWAAALVVCQTFAKHLHFFSCYSGKQICCAAISSLCCPLLWKKKKPKKHLWPLRQKFNNGVWSPIKPVGTWKLCVCVCRLCECSAGLFVSSNEQGCALPTCTFSTQLNGPRKIIKCLFTVAGTQQ